MPLYPTTYTGDTGLRGPIGETGTPGTKGDKGDQGNNLKFCFWIINVFKKVQKERRVVVDHQDQPDAQILQKLQYR